MHIKHRNSCRICGNTNLADVIDLGYQHLQGCFIKEGVPTPSKRLTPNRIVRCDVSKNEGACGLVQTAHTVPPEIMYANYWYQSGISNTMRNHLKSIVDLALKKNPKANKVLDIACNDGTLLDFYPSIIGKRVGIDPSDITGKVNKDYPIINDFYPSPNLKEHFDVITSIAMFYDLEDPLSFVNSIKNNLSETGLWCFEVAYLPAILSNLCYDTIVSEHLEHYHLAPLEYLMDFIDLKIVDVYLNPTNGGSIQCWATHKDCPLYDTPDARKRISAVRLSEFDLALDTDSPYDIFRQKVTVQKHDLQALLRGYKDAGLKIHLYGASTKANTLIEYCNVAELIDFAAERSPEKYGARTLSGICIVSEEESRAMKPDVYLVGPWHFKQEILEREKDMRKQGTKFVFPLPKVSVE